MEMENKRNDKLSKIMHKFYERRTEMTGDDYDYIINQLQTHQIELELQNEELRNTKLEVEKTKDRFSDLYDFAPVAYFTLTTAGIIKELNLTAAEMFGKPRKLLHNTPLMLLFAGDEQEKFHMHLNSVLTEKHKVSCELRIKDKVGDAQFFLIESALAEENGEKIIRSIATDITKQKNAEIDMKRAAEEAERANMAKSSFLSNMSHELRTPLNAIIGFSEVMMIDEKDAEKRENLEIIKKSGRILLEMINDLLDISKIEAGMMKVMAGVFDINATIESVAKTFSKMSSAKGNKLTVKNEIVNNLIESDEQKIRQILVNLIGNAVKFTENGEVVFTIKEERGEISDRKVIFEIEDSGIGIPAAKMEKLYVKFEQGEDFLTKKHGGTGLGLAIVKELVTLLGGEIKCSSVVDKGTKFSVTIPVKIRKKLELEMEQHGGGMSEGILRDQKILIAEDNETNVKLLKLALKGSGAESVVAFNGVEAMEEIEKGKFDFILIDIQMPLLNGLEVIKKIREKGLNTKIVVISAFAAKSDIDKAYSAGADEYIIKPFGIKTFREKIEKLLKRDVSL